LPRLAISRKPFELPVVRRAGRPRPALGLQNWPDRATDPATGANVVLVAAGWGDGSYPTFIGRDADGAVVRFVTDFLVTPA
jgi:hypothetical protein